MHQLDPDQVAALSSSYHPSAFVRVSRASTGDTVQLPIIDGELVSSAGSIDRTRLTLRTSLDYAPTGWQSPLIPADAVATVRYGVNRDTWAESLTVAQLWVEEVTTARPDGYVDVVAYSRSRRVSQAGLPFGNKSYPGEAAHVITEIVEAALGVTVPRSIRDGLGSAGVHVFGSEVFAGDAWRAVEDLSDRIGGETYFDSGGTLVTRATPTPSESPDLTLRPGKDGTILAYGSRTDRSGANRVRVRFTDPGPDPKDPDDKDRHPDRVAKADADPPAQWDGPYGRVRLDTRRNGRVTQGQADRAAEALLDRAGGLLRTVTLECLPDPRVEVGDTVRVIFLNGAAERFVVDEVRLPLIASRPMELAMRAKPW
jgi:hypothetical protein